MVSLPSSSTMFRVPRRKALMFLFVGLGFSVAGLILVRSGNVFGWVAMAFTPVVVLAVWQLLSPGWIKISDDSVEVCQVLRFVRSYELERCSEFFIWEIPGARGQEAVGFDYAELGTTRRWSAFSRRRYGFSETISDLYDVPPDVLAEALNAARDRAIGS